MISKLFPRVQKFTPADGVCSLPARPVVLFENDLDGEMFRIISFFAEGLRERAGSDCYPIPDYPGRLTVDISFKESSEHKEESYDACDLIRRGLAYVDDLTKEEMREYRGTLKEPGKNSPYRDRSPEENMDLFLRMKNGEFPEGSRTLRAKIDMASPNINLRDPAIYRIKYATHHRTGDKWCIYPMYDFAHPIGDALEAAISCRTAGSPSSIPLVSTQTLYCG